MAISEKPKSKRWLVLHFLVRLLGLTGALAAAVGLVLRLVQLDDWAMPLIYAGGGLAALAILNEIRLALTFVAGRRSAFGLNVVVQIALAIALVAGVNYYSFEHFWRFDCTRDHQFTIPADIRAQLTQLRSDKPTQIILHQTHKSTGVDQKRDSYDSAAERKVVEKVRDLVDEFQELGPRFRVEVLDVQDEDYQNKLGKVAENAPALREAIERAPESSIFFYGDGKVQRLAFQDIYELDKQSSQQAADGRGNLVLLYQGVGPFARKVLNVDEKKPRIAVGVIHELLSMEGADEYGMSGAKKSLNARGFDSRDVILKKWSEFGPPQPAVFTYDESKFERLEEQLADLESSIKSLDEELKDLKGLVKLWKTATLDELAKKYADQLKGAKLSETIRRNQLTVLDQNVALREILLTQSREERDSLAKEKEGLNVDSIAEQRRISDLKAKTERMLADCDLLIVPRMTLFNVARGDRISNRVYSLDEAQIAAVKEFIKSGKPVLFCFGPSNEPLNEMMNQMGGPDTFENDLAKLGIKMGKQTVLYNVESKSFAERRSGLVIMGSNVEPPPVEFDWKPGEGLPLGQASEATLAPNPIRESMRITARGLGKNQSLDLRLRHPRPVYYEPRAGEKLTTDPVFMMANAASWNEENPFPSRERTPRFEPPKSGDFSKGTFDEKRRGPFPIGVAVQTTAPAEWYSGANEKPANVRVAAIGHGGVFMGSSLTPVREKLLLDCCNWLLGRDDLLAKADHQWQYPRVALTATQTSLWVWGTVLGLPVLFIYLGVVVLMMRRLR